MSVISVLETLFIGPLKLLFEIIFQVAYKFVNHPGLSIVVLSLVMNILVLPLYKRADAMQEEARDIEAKLSRGVNHIKKAFSGDERMMILQTYYRQNNYKPTNALNGSVSLLLEVPFFMAAYQFLSHLDVLSGVSLGPIRDLASPDALITIGSFTVNVLPVLMTLINVISSAIYLKGFPLKTKIQLYGMAAFFLVFLYTSPSGLVFYWTLNNIFSLLKNIFYKIKNPAAVIRIITAILGVIGIVLAFVLYPFSSLKCKCLIFLGVCLLLPIAVHLIKSKCHFKVKEMTATPNKKLFVMGNIFLTVIIGFLIPVTFISASPQEYVDISYFHHPLWYVVSSLAMAAGFFLVWFGVFYWLASPKAKVIFERAVLILCGVSIVNYMFFGTKLGNISSALVYDGGMSFGLSEILINIGVVIAVAAVLYFIAIKWAKVVPVLLITASIALIAMGGMHINTTVKAVNNISVEQSDEIPNFSLSKDGENVVVIMMDRALGSYLPYLMEEKPELREKFGGFTYYTNVVSHGGFTNFGTPAVFGGYEYTPIEMNKRDKEGLTEKHNEALKVLPVLFDRNDYDVTVFDPVYANYNWSSDTSIYNEYPDIKAFVTEGAFLTEASKKRVVENNHRNFFCFSAMKCMPLFMQPLIYDHGTYHQAATYDEEYIFTVQTVEDGSTSKAQGGDQAFIDSYNVINNLKNITHVSDSNTNTFLMMANNATHQPMLLQKPNYVPAEIVDNTVYDENLTGSVTVNGKEMQLETLLQVSHYHVNMSVMLRIGEWLDYLREQDVYDNTKIIIVSDHGDPLKQFDELIADDIDLQHYHPLLMVKDFGSKDFKISDEFMTNADVPSLATKGSIENPVNPFTNKPINADEKALHDQYVIISNDWDVMFNNGNTFNAARWAKVNNNIWESDNWSFYKEEAVLKEYAFPQ